MAATYGQNATITGTPSQLTATATPVKYGTLIKALSGNAASVWVQPASGVTTGTGWELAAGDEMMVSRDEAADASQIYVVATSGTLGVCFRAA